MSDTVTTSNPSSADESTPVRARLQAMQQIYALLGINEGVEEESAEKFWRQVGIQLAVERPNAAVAEVARQVFDKIDEEWDDDYVEEDVQVPSVEAYETLYSKLRGASPTEVGDSEVRAGENEETEDDDDSIGHVESGLTWETRTTTTEVKYLLKFIEDGSLVLNPKWQRNFVWKLSKQRRLVESILLGLPVPSLLLFTETSSGNMYVIDGRQRLETVSRFVSPRPKKGHERRRFKTYSAKEPGWGPGEKLSPAANKYFDDLPQEFKTRFMSATLVLHTFIDLPGEKLYQIFKRYNTGAEKLKAAEIRNAVYQASPLHEMLYRLAGEHRSDKAFESEAERQTASRLESIMKRKVERYGAYDFLGRYFAFSYMSTGSVANATNEFMAKYGEGNPQKFRDEFIRVLEKTLDWYTEYPLITPREDGKFHAFLATIQMVSTRHMLIHHVDTGRVREDEIRNVIDDRWVAFADDTLQQKQNSTAFWSRQKDWINLLEETTAALSAA